MKRNGVVFYTLAFLAIGLCVAGLLRYDRSRKTPIVLPSQTPVFLEMAPAEMISVLPEVKPFFHEDFAEASTVAQLQKKPMMLLFTAKNCLFSRQMLETTFPSDALKPFLQRFVLVKIDVNGHPDICRWLNIESTPTIQFLSSDGVPLQRLNGVAQPEDIIRNINSTMQTISAHNRVLIR